MVLGHVRWHWGLPVRWWCAIWAPLLHYMGTARGRAVRGPGAAPGAERDDGFTRAGNGSHPLVEMIVGHSPAARAPDVGQCPAQQLMKLA